MEKNMTHIQYAGALSYRGPSSDPDYNERVVKANLKIDEYNSSVGNYKGCAEQMAYQCRMLDEVEGILRDKKTRYEYKQSTYNESWALPPQICFHVYDTMDGILIAECYYEKYAKLITDALNFKKTQLK